MDAPILRFDRYSPPGPQFLTTPQQVGLEITRGRVQQRFRPVKGRAFLIGTARDCDLVLGDDAFPEAYAYILVQAGKVVIRRVGTGPELSVCGEPVETAELCDGDRVAFGPFELRAVISSRSELRCLPSGSAAPGEAGSELASNSFSHSITDH